MLTLILQKKNLLIIFIIFFSNIMGENNIVNTYEEQLLINNENNYIVNSGLNINQVFINIQNYIDFNKENKIRINKTVPLNPYIYINFINFIDILKNIAIIILISNYFFNIFPKKFMDFDIQNIIIYSLIALFSVNYIYKLLSTKNMLLYSKYYSLVTFLLPLSIVLLNNFFDQYKIDIISKFILCNIILCLFFFLVYFSRSIILMKIIILILIKFFLYINYIEHRDWFNKNILDSMDNIILILIYSMIVFNFLQKKIIFQICFMLSIFLISYGIKNYNIDEKFVNNICYLILGGIIIINNNFIKKQMTLLFAHQRNKILKFYRNVILPQSIIINLLVLGIYIYINRLLSNKIVSDKKTISKPLFYPSILMMYIYLSFLIFNKIDLLKILSNGIMIFNLNAIIIQSNFLNLFILIINILTEYLYKFKVDEIAETYHQEKLFEKLHKGIANLTNLLVIFEIIKINYFIFNIFMDFNQIIIRIYDKYYVNNNKKSLYQKITHFIKTNSNLYKKIFFPYFIIIFTELIAISLFFYEVINLHTLLIIISASYLFNLRNITISIFMLINFNKLIDENDNLEDFKLSLENLYQIKSNTYDFIYHYKSKISNKMINNIDKSMELIKNNILSENNNKNNNGSDSFITKFFKLFSIFSSQAKS